MRESKPKADVQKVTKTTAPAVAKKEVETKKPLANSVFTFAQQIN
jgi:hypothetical protein